MALRCSVDPVHALYSTSTAPIEWDHVELAIVSLEPDYACSICLEWPTVPRITLCGHIYCLHCVVQYLTRRTNTDVGHANGRHASAPCPLCSAQMSLGSLKRVILQQQRPYAAGDRIGMRVLRRDPDQRVRLCTQSQSSHDMFPRFGTPEAIYNKLNVVTFEELYKVTCQEAAELQELRTLLSVGPSVKGLPDTTIGWLGPTEEIIKRGLASTESRYRSEEYKHANEALGLDVVQPRSRGPPRSIATLRDAILSCVFMQDTAGGQYYVDPIDMDILIAHYQQVHAEKEENSDGSFVVPEVLNFAIKAVLEVKRFEVPNIRWLSTLPRTTTLSLCAVDLESIVKPEILEKFSDRLRQRDEGWKDLYGYSGQSNAGTPKGAAQRSRVADLMQQQGVRLEDFVNVNRSTEEPNAQTANAEGGAARVQHQASSLGQEASAQSAETETAQQQHGSAQDNYYNQHNNRGQSSGGGRAWRSGRSGGGRGSGGYSGGSGGGRTRQYEYGRGRGSQQHRDHGNANTSNKPHQQGRPALNSGATLWPNAKERYHAKERY